MDASCPQPDHRPMLEDLVSATSAALEVLTKLILGGLILGGLMLGGLILGGLMLGGLILGGLILTGNGLRPINSIARHCPSSS